MKRSSFKVLGLVLVSGIILAGCGDLAGKSSSGTTDHTAEEQVPPAVQAGEESGSEEESSGAEAVNDTAQTATELVVRFGDEGEPFTMYLYDNDTAAAIARHVGSSNWRLPIYHYDDYDNWEVMQYYDIPDRYEIPSAPEQITEEKAGAVYYSEPNRIILFYQDAEVSAEYTPVGYFDDTDEFLEAVQDNPVLEGWGNKIVQISDGE